MRQAWTWPLPWAYDSPFVLDARAVGVFRIVIAATLLVDQVAGLGDWHAFRSGAGLVPLSDSRDWHSPWHWSLYWLSDGPVLPVVLELVRLVATVTLAIGIRSRLSSFVLFLVLSSLATRNPLVLYGGDRVLIVMAFFGAFLPLGARWSVERLWVGGERETKVCSAGTAAYVAQVLLVWWMSGLHKTGTEWWPDGTAVSMALHLEAFATDFARLWRGYDWLTRPLTYSVYCEPYRVSRRLQTLRDWSDETFKQILPGASGTGSAVGPGPPGRARNAMGGDRLGVVEGGLFGRDATQVGSSS